MNEQRLIDANEIVKAAEHAYNEWNLAMAAAEGNRQINRVFKMKDLCKAVKAVAKAAPTVDAVAVVRCKDCRKCVKHRTRRGNLMYFCSRIGGKIDGAYQVDANGFCSYGKRRVNDGL